ncbi:hypothetical protein [Solemya elarraichensis gill symbiont]|uniref:Uncharacterized protein n=1 Tax=Solemya elarraichensis gill symbiont TaxID=1918949 RepID=A0A1T2LCL1_9GAMM|nr:hypothetical protein [Solemya elarraichensis gill symbiont]OOZ42831.1 hypothetical protein BOW52_01400 [Solemya elarraichensis gill symbiont]
MVYPAYTAIEWYLMICSKSSGGVAVYCFVVALLTVELAFAADPFDSECDLTLLSQVELYSDIHAGQLIDLRPDFAPESKSTNSAQKFREALAGLGYILTGDIDRLDHLSRPPDQPCDVHSDIGYDTKLNDSLLFKAQKREGEKTRWYLFDSNIDEWH